MASTLNTVLERLRAFGADKLTELDAREEEHRGWLASAVAEVKQQIAAFAPAAKRQRLDAVGAAAATAVEQEEQEKQVGGVKGRAAVCVGGEGGERSGKHLGCSLLAVAICSQNLLHRFDLLQPARGRKTRGKAAAAQEEQEEAAPEPAAQVEPEEAPAKPAAGGRRGKQAAAAAKEEVHALAEEQPGEAGSKGAGTIGGLGLESQQPG